MRNVYYTYHVSRSDDPDVEKSMETIEDVQRYTKLSVLSIYKNMLHEGNVKGWTVSRTPLPKNKKEKPNVEIDFSPHNSTCFSREFLT